MTQGKAIRLSKVVKEFNVGIHTIIEFLDKKGHEVSSNPNTKIEPELYEILQRQFNPDLTLKKESEKLNLQSKLSKKETISLKPKEKAVPKEPTEETVVEEPKEVASDSKPAVKIITKIDLEKANRPTRPTKKTKAEKEKDAEVKASEVKAAKEEIKVVPEEPKAEEPKAKEVKPESKPAETKVEPKEEPKVKAEPVLEEKPVEAPIAKEEKPVVKEVKKETPAETKSPEKAPKVEEVKTEAPKKETPKAEKPKVDAPVEKAPKKEVKIIGIKKGLEEKIIKLDAPKDKPAKMGDNVVTNIPPEPEMEVKIIGKIDLSTMNQRTRPAKKTKEEKKAERLEKERGTDKGKDGVKKGPYNKGPNDANSPKRKRKRITDKPKVDINKNTSANANKDQRGARPNTPFNKGKGRKRPLKAEVSEVDVQKQIKDTLARLTNKGKSNKGAKYRRDKRDAVSTKAQKEVERQAKEKNVLKVTEFVTANELALMMDVPVNSIISTCMTLGLFVSINQRLDAETMALLAEEYNYTVEFVSVELVDLITEEEDTEEDLLERPPIVTVMGHVDHGKTSLLDFIRHANVIAGEAGGITQHIGAYSVTLKDGKQITFLDTPGHEAFTAMRARGAQITDVAIIVISADDSVMPQTIEAINHAHAAGVPIVFAINKIDKAGANPDKIREQLASMNFMTEDWGGKYQVQEISAKEGINIDELLEKVLLEAELLELKANPDKKAKGTVLESSLDKGRGYVCKVLVEAGTLEIGDIMIAGQYFGHVKAMFNERGSRIKTAGPSIAAEILGLGGAPQAGDNFNIMNTDREAKEIANKREQLQREQGMRTKKHITLDEIGRRIAIGNFQELNVVIKGDVDGSIEALSDSLIKLSTEEIQVNIIHKAVGQISESDILLAAASNAIVIGFQVRPSIEARRIAEKEQIDIRLYSIIYDAINELKAAMEGMLSPDIKEEVTASAEVHEVFKITKVGTVAGCIIRDGKLTRNTKIRLIRDGIVVHTGELGSLKRFKDDVKDVANGYECGLNIVKFNDIVVGDMIEAYHEVEVKKVLK